MIFSSKISVVYIALVRCIIYNWVIDHGKFAREKGFTIMDAWFYSEARKNSYDNHSSLNIPANISGATACARVNEAFVIRKQRSLGVRMAKSGFFLERYFLIPVGRSNRFVINLPARPQFSL